MVIAISNSAFFKIFVNYMQTISIINSLKLNWDDVWSQLFQVQQISSGSLEKVMALDCIYESIFFLKVLKFIKK